jgi:hypothetical protein
MSIATALSTSLLLVESAPNTGPYLVYLPNLSTTNALLTIRDTNGYVSSSNPIQFSTLSGASLGVSSSYNITSPYGFVTFHCDSNGLYVPTNMFGTPVSSATIEVTTIQSGTVNLRDGLNYDPLFTSNAGLYLSTTAIGQVNASNLTSTVTGLGTFGYVSSYAIYGSNDSGFVLTSTVQGLSSSLSTGYTTVTSATISSISQFSDFSPTQIGNYPYIAVGSYGGNPLLTIQYSLDQRNWRPAVSGGFVGFGGNTVAYNNAGLWVALGYGSSQNSCIQYSVDGSNWTAANSGGFIGGFPGGGLGVAYGDGLWVAVGAGTNPSRSIQTSTDGSNWSPCLSGGFPQSTGYDVAYANGRWVAVGYGNPENNAIQTSSNGYVWTPAPSGNGFGVSQYVGNTVTYGNGLWVIGGIGNQAISSIQTSTDTQTWTPVLSMPQTPASGIIQSIAYNGVNQWVAGANGGSPAQTLLHSTDALRWNYSVSGGFLNGIGYGVAWTGANWLAVGQDVSGLFGPNGTASTIQSSSDGSNWVPSITGGFFAPQYWGYGIGAVTRSIPTISTPTLVAYLEEQPNVLVRNSPHILRTNMYTSTLSFDNTLFVNNNNSTVGINTSNATSTLTVAGSTRVTALSVSSFLTINKLSSIQSLSGYGQIYYNPTTGFITVGTINP